MTTITDAYFNQWIEWLFNPELPFDDRHWNLDGEESEFLELDYPTKNLLVIRLLESPKFLFERFDRDQVGRGLWCIFQSGQHFDWKPDDKSIDPVMQLRGVRALHNLYEHVFAPHCVDQLNHTGYSFGALTLPKSEDSPLNAICYMLWDIWLCSTLSPTLMDAKLEVLERALALPSTACQESAIHGLGHTSIYEPERTFAILDAYMQRAETPDVLWEYADRATTNDIA